MLQLLFEAVYFSAQLLNNLHMVNLQRHITGKHS
jgi:hypothetical protein